MVDLQPEEPYPITGIYSFGRGLIKRPIINGSDTAYLRMARLKEGQVVMSKLNAWEGALAVVGESFSDTYVSPEYPVFTINTAGAYPAYLRHLLAWPELWRCLTPRGSMVRRKRTTPATLLGTRVPLPDLHEQRRVANKLDAAIKLLERVIHLKEQAAALTRLHADALFRSVAQQAPLSRALYLDSDFVDVEPDSPYPITGIYSFGRGLIKRTPILGSETAYAHFTQLRAGQVVMSKLNAWEGALAVVDDSFSKTYVSPEYPVFSVNVEEADPDYIDHLLAWPNLWSMLTPRGSMVRRKRTSPTTFLGTKVPLPDLAEQRRIARQLTLARKVADAGAAQTDQLHSLRSALLNAAFSGQL
ncbi:restriction endonuclease subunit S [Streptomyces sp. CBMA123]|uniref:restriction endonuclease subunit S n=1 Tax=Streptomyces sp. CBMA123 TaxID=1896313 RepID=UPI001661E189|nr:hypothetical protein [Streptomyces sp. CBMA123]